MKKALILIIFILITFVSYNQNEKIVPFEKIILNTDRDLYLAGENLYFDLYFLTEEKFKKESISKIVFIEIFDYKKNSVIKKKYKVIDGKSNGRIELPHEINSGNYFLIAYSQYLKNFCSKYMNSSVISIVNPNSVMYKNGSVENNTEISKEPYLNDEIKELKIEINKDSFKPKEQIEFSVLNTNSNTDINFSVSVVKKGTIIDNKLIKEIDAENNTTGQFIYVPELRNSGLQGIIVNKETNEPVVDADVYISVLGDIQQLHTYRTGDDGKFYSTFYDLDSINDIYITLDTLHIYKSQIQVYNEFLNECIPSVHSDFLISAGHKELIEEMHKNNQLSNLKNSKVINKEVAVEVIKSQFGEADFTIYLKNFIKLPTLHEVFDEIIPSTRIKEEKGRFYLSVYDEELKLNYNEPLILLDNMPVFNINELLKIKPSLINKIEVINKRYLIGKKIFNGIVLLSSNTKNFCKISIPDESVFVKFQGISPYSEVCFPVYEDNIKSRIPDFRTLLYWETDLILEKDPINIDFYSSDHESEYDIIVRGIDNDGTKYYGSKTVEVKR